MNQDVLEDRLREHYRRRTQHLNTERPNPTTIRAYAETATPEPAFRPRRILAIAGALVVMAGIGVTLRDTGDPAPSTGTMVAVTTTADADEPPGGHDTETIQVSASEPATGVARIVEVNRVEFIQGQTDLATRLSQIDRDHYYQYGAIVEGDSAIAVATVKCEKNEAAMSAAGQIDSNDPRKTLEKRPVPVCEQLDPPIRLTDPG